MSLRQSGAPPADFGLDGGEEAGGHGGVEVGWHIERARYRLRPQVLRAHNPRAEAASAPARRTVHGTVASLTQDFSFMHRKCSQYACRRGLRTAPVRRTAASHMDCQR